MQVTTVTDFDKFINRLVIMRKAVLLGNQLSVTFSAILKVTITTRCVGTEMQF